jgi:hypothetical protein
MEMVITPNMNVAKRKIIIGSIINLNHGSGGFLAKRNLSRSSRLPTTNTGVVGTPQMVFTNPRMTTHVHKTTD